jgi:hypothetical protein
MPADELPGWIEAWKPDPGWIGVRPLGRDHLSMLFASVEHRAWIKAMEDHIGGVREAPPPLDERECHFGQWLAAERMTRGGTDTFLEAIDVLHLQVHAVARESCELKARGRTLEALARLEQLHGLRKALDEHFRASARGVEPLENAMASAG